jgi:hypothetical protein
MRKSIISVLSFVFIIQFAALVSGSSIKPGNTSLEGKGMYLWHLWTADGGGKNLNTIITKLQSVGAKWLVIKMADGDSYYYRSGKGLYDWATANYGSMDSVVSIFHANGIKLLAFQYVYGTPHHWNNPVSETDVANSILNVKGIDGLIIDAEVQYDTLANRYNLAQAYCDSIHAHHPDAYIGLTSWARVDGHNTFPWQTFLDRVDVNMPQTYWAARPITPSSELNNMNSQFTFWTNRWIGLGDSAADKPIMPLGQGEYFGYGNDVKQGDIKNFCNLSQSTYKYPGVSLWEYGQITHSYVWDEYAAAWQITSVSDQSNIPGKYNLSQNYPNPFNPTTTINYVVPKRSLVIIKVYNILGKEVAALVNEEMPAGHYSIKLSADKYKLSSGVYFYRMQAGDFIETKKFVLMK